MGDDGRRWLVGRSSRGWMYCGGTCTTPDGTRFCTLTIGSMKLAKNSFFPIFETQMNLRKTSPLYILAEFGEDDSGSFVIQSILMTFDL